ncbi:MAG TPA: hypothetical protein VK666_21735 [Chryseolinea sp.]|nr:hypothetical protein [Chryseolinea sp.]
MRKPKSGDLEKEKRLRMVQEWILQDHITTDIISQCINSWDISERQAMRYLASAKIAFAKITEKKLEHRLNYHIQRRNKLLRDLDPKYRKSPPGIKVQLDVLEDIAKLEQLYKLKIEVGGPKGAAAIQTDSTHKVIFENYAAK